jgi:hypothetical protein
MAAPPSPPVPAPSAVLHLDDAKLQELEEKFDPEMRFRPSVPPATVIIKWLLVTLSVFHYYTPASA